MELTSKYVTSRKNHRCFGCAQCIPSGTKVKYYAGIWEGDFSYGYICAVCEIVLEDFDSYEDTYYEGDLYEDRELWQSAARKFEERTGTSHNSVIMPFRKAETA
jgi:hypothetical protein